MQQQEHPNGERAVSGADDLCDGGRHDCHCRRQQCPGKHNHPLAWGEAAEVSVVGWPRVHNAVPHRARQHVQPADRAVRRDRDTLVARPQRLVEGHRARRPRRVPEDQE